MPKGDLFTKFEDIDAKTNENLNITEQKRQQPAVYSAEFKHIQDMLAMNHNSLERRLSDTAEEVQITADQIAS